MASAAAEPTTCSDTRCLKWAGVVVLSAAAEPTMCSAARCLKRAGVAVLSAVVKTDRAYVVMEVARTFASEGRGHLASSVDGGNLAGRVVARAVHHGKARWVT